MKEYFVLFKNVVVNVKNINYMGVKFANNTYDDDYDFWVEDLGDEIEIGINKMVIGFVGGDEISIILNNDTQKAKEEFNQYVEVIMNKFGENTLLLD